MKITINRVRKERVEFSRVSHTLLIQSKQKIQARAKKNALTTNKMHAKTKNQEQKEPIAF
jgi:hypothetical protein